MSQDREDTKGFLFDVRVVEIGEERGEFCGKLLAGAGADVIKAEPPGGSPSRGIGPFDEDVQDPERSLYFWHYNVTKRGVTLDLAKPEGRDLLKRLAAQVDVIVESFPPGHMDSLGVGYADLSALNRRLIMASVTPFGQSGPYRDWKSSDLVHLAMGGQMMVTGYDPTPDGEYDTPPIAPQMWHAHHVAGVQTYNAIVAALLHREAGGEGQHLDASVHRIMSCNTYGDVPYWIFNRREILRQTARYGEPRIIPENIGATKDGRHLLTYLFQARHYRAVIEMLAKNDSADDLTDPKYDDDQTLMQPEVSRHINAVARRWVSRYKYDRDVWREAQSKRLHWAPLRKPHENLDDPHWDHRQTFADVEHDDIGKSFRYPNALWLSRESPWRTGPRAPNIGEHNDDVYGGELGLTDQELAALKAVGAI